jgi:hypothetical protein
VPSEGYRCILIHYFNITRTRIGEEGAKAAKGVKERKNGVSDEETKEIILFQP